MMCFIADGALRLGLAIIGILVVASVRTTVAQTNADACWIPVANTHSFYGSYGIKNYTQFDVPTVDNCKLACLLTFGCNSIDWDPSFPSSVSCWLFNSSATTGYAANITHWTLNKTCAASVIGCWSAPQTSVQVLYGTYVATANKVWLCQGACINDSSCTGIDFNNQTNKCWLIYGGQKQFTADNVTHYDVNRQPGCNDYFSVAVSPALASGIVSTTLSSLPPTAVPSLSSTTTPPTITSKDSEGTSFVLSFPPSEPGVTNGSQSITVCTRSYDDVSVYVTSPTNNFSVSLTVSFSACQTIQVPPGARMTLNNSSTWSNHVIVTSSNLVSVVVSLYGSCSSYYVLPESSLGSVYYAVTASPNKNDAAMIVVTAISASASTAVEFSWPAVCSVLLCNGNNISPDNQVYLSRGQSVCIWSKSCDLSGTMIAGRRPIAVVSGNINYKSNYVVVQMIPMWAWSMTYVMNNDSIPYDVIVVGNSSAFSVSITNNITYKTYSDLSRLNVMRISNQTGQLYLNASQRVMVVVYPTSAPTAILLPGTDSYQTSYSFSLPQLPTSSVSYILEVTARGPLLQNSFMLVTGNNMVYKSPLLSVVADTWSASLSLPAGSYVVTLLPNSNIAFGAYVLSHNGNCAMGFPLSLGQQTPLLTSSVMPVTTAQAIRPAYIVLAGLGAGNLLLVVIAVVLLCSYPIRGEEGIAASATVAESSSRKREKKSKKVNGKKETHNTYIAGDVEMNENGATNVHHENYDDGHVVETNPYYDQGGHGSHHDPQFNEHHHEKPTDEHETETETEVYGNQAEIDNGETLKASYRHSYDDQEDSHVF